MSFVESIRSRLSEQCRAEQVGSMVAVTTQCIFPSNGAVTVFVQGGERECVVSDYGETARVVRSHGVGVPESNKWLNSFCKKAGLEEKAGQIISPPVPFEFVANAIVLVANTAATAARHAVDEFGVEKISFKELIYQVLRQVFNAERIVADAAIPGQSNRVYHPDYFIRTGSEMGVIVDAVTPNANSINAKAAAHFDIAQREQHPKQTIVFDSSLNWPAADLSFLKSTTADLVPYHKLRPTLTPLH